MSFFLWFLSFFVFSFQIKGVTSLQNSFFNLTPYEPIEFSCTSIEHTFQFSINTKEVYEILMPQSFSVAFNQFRMKTLDNATFLLNETFNFGIDYIYSTGEKSATKFTSSYEDPQIMNFQFLADKGTYNFNFECSDNINITINQFSVTFFPSNIKLRALEFDSNYQLIKVPGYFSGTYAKYETFIIYAIYHVDNQKPNLLIKINNCIGDVDFLHLDQVGMNQFLADKASNVAIPGDNKRNNYIIQLHEENNFFVVQARSGVIFQYGMPSKAMVRITTKSVDFIEDKKPAYLISTTIYFNYRFPEVLLNFSKIVLDNGLEDSPPNKTNSGADPLSNNNNNALIGNGSNLLNQANPQNYTNNTNIITPIKYKIIIAQNILFLSIVSKCGLDVFQSIPKMGNFQDVNTYYKEIDAYFDKNVSLAPMDNNINNSNKTVNMNDTINADMNINNSLPSNDSNGQPGFLPKNDTNSDVLNTSDTNDTEVLDDFATFKPFTLYDKGNNLNLLVNLDTKDYYFITAIGYLTDLNDTYYFYDPILIKDNRFNSETIVDIGLIFIIIGAIVFTLIMIFCFYKCTKKYMKKVKKSQKDKGKKKHNNKFSDQQKILFGKQMDSTSDKAKQDRLSQILGPSDIKIAKIM